MLPTTWTRSALAAIDVLKTGRGGALSVTEFAGPDGTVTSQTAVATPAGIVVLTSWVDDVPAERRADDERDLGRIREYAGLPPIAIRYFGPPRWHDQGEVSIHDVDLAHPSLRPDDARDEREAPLMAGCTSPVLPWTIALHIDLAGPERERTIAHEARHCAQFFIPGFGVELVNLEADAMAWAEAWMHR